MDPLPRYPVEWIDRFQLANGAWVTLRPVLPQDDEIERLFIANGLTSQSRYLRFQNGLRELPEAVLQSFTHIDYHDHFALIAESFDGGQHLQVADVRFVREAGTEGAAEFGIAVADAWQGQGLASRLLRSMVLAARAEGIAQLYGDVLRSNVRMLALAKAHGFATRRHPDDATLVRVQRSLAPEQAPLNSFQACMRLDNSDPRARRNTSSLCG
ncbi:MAG TPA: GNAT family N-acetyltransferase [Burkholderiaceae bacterium]|nr:GNAT family N-acetyltransferase [Burkholderiaceae bacterium]